MIIKDLQLNFNTNSTREVQLVVLKDMQGGHLCDIHIFFFGIIYAICV